MTLHPSHIAELDQLAATIADKIDTYTLDELAEVWAMWDELHRTLGVLVRDLSVAVASKLADVDYDPKVGYELPDGTVIHHRQSPREKWQGRDVIAALAHDYIDPDTGEVWPAVPVAVLWDVLPAMGEDATSARFRTTGLKDHNVDPDRFRSREWEQARTYRGPKP